MISFRADEFVVGNPHKDVIVISGDGGMQMNIQEMATAVCYELPIIICILNNGDLGNVRQWQEMFYNKHYSSTCMRYRRSCEAGCNTLNHTLKRPPEACHNGVTGGYSCPEYTPIHMKEILFVRVNHCSDADITELFRIAKVFGVAIIDYNGSTVLLECTQTEKRNDDLIVLLKKKFVSRIEIARGGSVAVEAYGFEELSSLLSEMQAGNND